MLSDATTIDHVALNDLYFELSMLDKCQSSVNEMNNAKKKSKDLQTNNDIAQRVYWQCVSKRLPYMIRKKWLKLGCEKPKLGLQ